MDSFSYNNTIKSNTCNDIEKQGNNVTNLLPSLSSDFSWKTEVSVLIIHADTMFYLGYEDMSKR